MRKETARQEQGVAPRRRVARATVVPDVALGSALATVAGAAGADDGWDKF